MQTIARRVARFSDLREDRAERVVVDGENILLVRHGDTVRAYAADCPHAGGPLEQGGLCHGRIICPWHKGTFDAATGSVLEPPPLVALDRYPVVVSSDDVIVAPRKQPQAVRHAAAAQPHYVVIGAGAAGAAACTALREYGFGGRLTLIGDDPHAPYDCTALTKFVLSADMAPADVPPLLAPDWLARHDVERIVAKVARLDVPRRTIHFADGGQLTYDTALLATGSVPKLPAIAGIELGGVHVLRNRDDAAALVEAIGEDAEHTRVAILGGSFIGLETAAALRKRGTPVTVISPEKTPFARQFGERAGAMFRTLHERNGVLFHLDTKVVSLEGEAGRVHEVTLENGDRVAADVVLLDTGVAPATGFVEGLPLQKDGGVIVNAGMQAAPGLYAAGDIAVFPLHEHQEPLRIEHWRVAQQHARIAAQNMCGARHRYAGVPYFWTYHFGKNFEYLGHASEWDDIVIDGELERQQFVALYVKDGKVVAVLACERQAHTARLIDAMRGGVSCADALALVQSVVARNSARPLP
ncbi:MULTISPECIES: FAD-dependent oxidoreductase [Paraburkholderia]|jgi:NADPH-dependent 2,4-dienoyl-CoA reductase/sulfur reductase-like enzyme/nitrite reductase/ring-hydroxylating ferredoxin subunit|uniref:Reductase C-terminal n=1 Tax=Paraburkholderia terricola TaxID=169427 RepID=A0A1M6MUV7_9BURK|nr:MULTISPECIES: FAD-dependent oxidoreductase [Paraburkholderia]AXE96499.1 pyridine nucleotide-disulfide oxidoreductase [Paraburkholderia terricola]SDO03591.1 Reductase C-terminal [Paraburkholderia sediminicola]SHJ87251.1 Reductase C-terminal [Paraburkholderia terricola]